jgi:transcriptional regulator PpsR
VPSLTALAPLAPELAATVARVASDIALVIDEHGVIRSAEAADDSLGAMTAQWIGRRFAEVVSSDTRRKADLLLTEAGAGGSVRRREINHPTPSGEDLPVTYTAVRLGSDGPLLVVGRDLRSVAAIQQRFVEAQQEMERGYWQRRQQEARYRLLFEVATDAVLIVDARSGALVEVNRAAADLLGVQATALAGSVAAGCFAAASRAAVEDLLASVAATGRPGEIRVRLAGGASVVSLAATLFGQEPEPLLLLRVRQVDQTAALASDDAALIGLLERTPDAIVIVDLGGVVRVANPAFLALCDLGSQSGVAGRRLADCIGAGSDEIASLLTQVRRRGLVARAAGRVRTAQGQLSAVDLTAVLLPEGDEPTIGLTLRSLDGPPPPPAPGADELARAVQHLIRRLGEQSLPALMRDASDLIERQLLQAALARSDGDRLRAAELLGIAAESLELRLLRQRLAEPIPRSPQAPDPAA